MSLTLTQWRKRLAARTGQPADDPILNLKFNDYINDSIQEFIASASWYFMVATKVEALVATQKEYFLEGGLVDPASDVDKLNEEVRLTTTFTKLHFVSEKDFTTTILDATEAGTPEYYTLRGYRNIQLYPTPDAAAVTAETSFDYEYFKETTVMSLSTDTSDLPVKYEPTVLWKACYYAHESMGNLQQASISLEAHERGLQRALWDNRKVVEMGQRDIIPPQPADHRQMRGLDHRYGSTLGRS